MKLPVFTGMIAAAVLFQAPAVMAQTVVVTNCVPGTVNYELCRVQAGQGQAGSPDIMNRPDRYPGPGRDPNPGRPNPPVTPPTNPGPGRPTHPGPGPIRPAPDRPGHGGWEPGRPGHGPGRPGPGRPGPGWPNPGRPHPSPWDPRPNPRPLPPPPPQNHYGESTVSFANITRRSGGEWLRISFYGSSYVDRVRLEVLRAGLKVHEAYAITNSGRRINLRELTYGGVMYAYDSISSNYISAGERIRAIDIRAESYGDVARINVTVQSSSGRPSIRAERP